MCIVYTEGGRNFQPGAPPQITKKDRAKNAESVGEENYIQRLRERIQRCKDFQSLSLGGAAPSWNW